MQMRGSWRERREQAQRRHVLAQALQLDEKLMKRCDCLRVGHGRSGHAASFK